MPLVAAAAIGAVGAFASAKASSSAAKKAAKLQADSSNQAATLQAQSSDKALDYEKAQADEDKRRYDESQQRNYQQYLSRYRAAQSLGHSIGFDMPDAPDYYAGSPSGPGAPPAAAAASGGGIPKSTGDVAKDMALANQLTGSNHTDPSYWVNAGYAKDPQYFFQKMLGMDAGGKDKPTQGPYAGGGSAAPAAPSSALGSRSVAAMLNPALGGGMPPPVQDFRLRGALNLSR